MDGSTLRQHYESAQRQSGLPRPELVPVDCPAEVRYLWGYFLSLNARRTGNGYGANAIANAEVLAWAARKGIQLSTWEQHALDLLEQLYLNLQPKPKAVKQND